MKELDRVPRGNKDNVLSTGDYKTGMGGSTTWTRVHLQDNHCNIAVTSRHLDLNCWIHDHVKDNAPHWKVIGFVKQIDGEPGMERTTARGWWPGDRADGRAGTVPLPPQE